MDQRVDELHLRLAVEVALLAVDEDHAELAPLRLGRAARELVALCLELHQGLVGSLAVVPDDDDRLPDKPALLVLSGEHRVDRHRDTHSGISDIREGHEKSAWLWLLGLPQSTGGAFTERERVDLRLRPDHQGNACVPLMTRTVSDVRDPIFFPG